MTEWEKVVEFHGHVCIGLAMGFCAARAALRALGVERAQDEELVAIVETDACGVDAIQTLTGCTLGKGNLLYRDYGKQAYTIGRRDTGEAVRVTVRRPGWLQSAEMNELREKCFAGSATEEEVKRYQSLLREMAEKLIAAPEEEVCTVKRVQLELPEKARIFNSVECAFCGEMVMEPRARVREGKFACIPCSEEYSRGWS